MSRSSEMDPVAFARHVVRKALKAGADDAEVYLTVDDYVWVRARRLAIEKVERAVVQGFGLKVLWHHRKAYVTGSDLTRASADLMIQKALGFARHSAPDRHLAIPDRPDRIPEIDLYDRKLARLRLADRIEIVKRMEDAAYAADRRVANTKTADYTDGTSRIIHVNSRGLVHTEDRTHCSLCLSVIAEQGDARQVGAENQRVRFLADLDPERVGREAGLAAASMLGAGPVPTTEAPVVLDNRVMLRLMFGFVGALDGERVMRGESFLKDQLGRPVAAPHVTLRDRPLMERGYGDMAVDGEGVLSRDKAILDAGVLTTFFHSVYSAARARTEPTGNVLRGSYETEGAMGPANLYLEPGTHGRDEIIRSVSRGLLVTDLMGTGLNPVTGDYSVGARGFWIDRGMTGQPVERVTVAANLRDIFAGIEEIGSDLRFWGSAGAPTVKVRRMSIGGT